MLNLNSALRAAGEAGAQELMNLTHLKFVPISMPTSFHQWFKTGMGWPRWAGRLHSKTCLQRGCLVLVYKKRPLGPNPAWCGCMARVTVGSWCHPSSPHPSPFSRLPQQFCNSSAQSSHRTELLGTAPHRVLLWWGVREKVETKMFTKTHPWVTPKQTLLWQPLTLKQSLQALNANRPLPTPEQKYDGNAQIESHTHRGCQSFLSNYSPCSH